MRESFKLINDSFVALETEFDEVIFLFEIVFATVKNMFSLINDVDVVKQNAFHKLINNDRN